MVNGILSSLERHIANEYRARNSMCSGRAIRIDDQDGDDRYPHFCTIRVEFNEAGDGFELSLNNLPWNSDLEDFIEEIDGEWRDTPTGRNLTVSLTTKSVPVIRKLARAIRRVTGRGQRYDDSNWKWITRRTADSLETFAATVAEHNRSRHT